MCAFYYCLDTKNESSVVSDRRKLKNNNNNKATFTAAILYTNHAAYSTVDAYAYTSCRQKQNPNGNHLILLAPKCLHAASK